MSSALVRVRLRRAAVRASYEYEHRYMYVPIRDLLGAAVLRSGVSAGCKDERIIGRHLPHMVIRVSYPSFP